MQIFSVGFAVTLAVGAVVLILAVPDTAYRFIAELSHVGSRIETVLFEMSRAAP
jgi:flagellar biosynthesis protein FliR